MSIGEIGILVVGILAALKDLTALTEKARRAIGLGLAFLIALFFIADSQGLLAGAVLAWLNIIVQAIAVALSAMGYLALPGHAARGIQRVRAQWRDKGP